MFYDFKKSIIYEIISVLKSIQDPEISVDIYELGLIYDIRISNHFFINIIMTLTSPNCPVVEILPFKVKNKIFNIKNVKNVEIILTFYPNWTYNMISSLMI
ncbi:metal-sulfur cluster assembly factor [Candidatus Karelsulcia muelleri]|uniref:metal-sulfur cluster assembly factor n=1 Tax=Candidatus Karelsulcia muelleri TaxID=336810 RepID=UPI00216B57C1|nr:iron-sulfur cluster assembly protein [Candidatus Karelsulcia muelleri]